MPGQGPGLRTGVCIPPPRVGFWDGGQVGSQKGCRMAAEAGLEQAGPQGLAGVKTGWESEGLRRPPRQAWFGAGATVVRVPGATRVVGEL